MLLVTMSLLATSTIRAETTIKQCENVLVLCDKALQETKKQVEVRDQIISASSQEILRQKEVIQDQESKLNSIFRNPWLYLGLGLVGGYLIAK